MKLRGIADAVLMATPFPVVAQSPLPVFEVATIKPIALSSMYMVGVNVDPNGKGSIDAFSLKGLICIAFNMSYWQTKGAELSEKDSYDVVAKPPDPSNGKPYTTRYSHLTIEDEQLRQMLQSLLTEQFQLKFHLESKTGTVYVLERNEKALALQPTKLAYSSVYASGKVATSPGRPVQWDTSVSQLARFLGAIILHKPVVDHTGLDGPFAFKSKFNPIDSDAQDYSDFLLTAIPEMGLRLRQAKGPMTTFVIDHGATSDRLWMDWWGPDFSLNSPRGIWLTEVLGPA